MSFLRLSVLAGVVCLGAVAASACGDDPSSNPDADAGADGALPDGAPPPVRAEFGLDTRPANPTCKAPAKPPPAAPVTFQRVFDNVQLQAPMMMAQIPGDSTRWFVALRGTANGGTADIVSFPVAAPPNQPTVVASVGPLQNVTNGEGGLLGMAFHPKFAQNGRLYVSFLTTGGANNRRSVVGYLTSPDNGATFGNYTEILGFDQTTATNHKGGGIAFGKDGFLYLGFGDGGGGDDAFTQGQNRDGLFSKVLRIDVDAPAGGKAYGIPADNPFAGGGGAPETFAYGFRNPFRISIDSATGDLWVGDVGQNQYEEIDLVKLGGNYGWPCREGEHDYITTAQSPQKCPSMAGLLDPVVEHQHPPPGNTRSLTGGVVYRGSSIPGAQGTYFYGDYERQDLFSFSYDAQGKPVSTVLNEQGGPRANWVSFANDNDGEVYALALNQGTIYKLVSTGGGAPSTFPDLLSKTGCADPADVKKPAPGLVAYGVNAPLWSDGAAKARFMALPDGQKIKVGADGDFDFPNGTVLVKSFSLGGKLVETRLLVRHDDGDWAGYSYEWNDAQTDAALLPSGKTKAVGAVTWSFPSRGECMRCHTEAAGRSLGLELGQQNGDFVYPSTNRISNQLKTLEHIDMFEVPVGPPEQKVAFPDPLGQGPLEARARAYLHSNCANCHRPQGGGRGDLDLRFGTSLTDTKACNADPAAGDLGVAGAKLLAAGAPDKSLITLRARASGANRMPPLGTSVVDGEGVKVLEDWIKSVGACP
ncbi:MAG: PQQ-dependent sugar dehydrogenase [Myxococcales bacterium]|nr:PQQ-dependent sugar dehydrogenase [Myxococcales bacterium]